MRTYFHQIHLWLSIPFGLIIAAICLSGAALVFEKEVMECWHRDLYYVAKVEAETIPVDQLLAKIASTLPDSVSVTGVTLFSERERAYQVTLSKPRRASIYVDPYTGEVKGRYERASFFTFMFRMHRWLLDSMKPGDTVYVGKLIVGISTLMFVFVLLSGVAIWVPRNRKALKNRLKVVVSKGQRRFWYDLHVAGGMYATVFLLVMSLTGLTWSFPWYRTAFYQAFGGKTEQRGQGQQGQQGGQRGQQQGQQQQQRGQQRGQHGKGELGKEGRPNKGEEEEQQSPFAHWQEVYNQLCVLHPGHKQINVSNGSATVSSDRLGNQRASDRYAFHPKDGEITETILYDDQEKSGKIRGWIYSVHVGNWGGMTTRILSFVAALLGGILPLTGYYFWMRKWKRKRASGR